MARGPGSTRGADPRAHLLGARRRRDARAPGGARSRLPTRSCTWTHSARSACACSKTRRSRPAWTPSCRRSRPPTGSRCCSSGSTTSRCARHEIRGNPAPLLASFVARIDRLKDEMISAEDYRAYAERTMAAADDRRRAHRRCARARVRRACTPTMTACWPSAARSTSATSSCARSSCSTSARTCASASRGALPARARGRVPRHQLRPGDAPASADRRAPAGDARGRGRPLPRGTADSSAKVVRLERSCRSGRRILDAAAAVAPGRKLTGVSGGRVRFWRCRSERAQAQAVAAEAEQLIAARSAARADLRARALGEERGRRDRVRARGACAARRACAASAAYFQRAEVRDVLAWLRALADPNDSGAVVRALSGHPSSCARWTLPG